MEVVTATTTMCRIEAHGKMHCLQARCASHARCAAGRVRKLSRPAAPAQLPPNGVLPCLHEVDVVLRCILVHTPCTDHGHGMQRYRSGPCVAWSRSAALRRAWAELRQGLLQNNPAVQNKTSAHIVAHFYIWGILVVRAGSVCVVLRHRQPISAGCVMDLLRTAWKHAVENPVTTAVASTAGVVGAGILTAHALGLTTLEHSLPEAGEWPCVHGTRRSPAHPAEPAADAHRTPFPPPLLPRL